MDSKSPYKTRLQLKRADAKAKKLDGEAKKLIKLAEQLLTEDVEADANSETESGSSSEYVEGDETAVRIPVTFSPFPLKTNTDESEMFWTHTVINPGGGDTRTPTRTVTATKSKKTAKSRSKSVSRKKQLDDSMQTVNSQSGSSDKGKSSSQSRKGRSGNSGKEKSGSKSFRGSKSRRSKKTTTTTSTCKTARQMLDEFLEEDAEEQKGQYKYDRTQKSKLKSASKPQTPSKKKSAKRSTEASGSARRTPETRVTARKASESTSKEEQQVWNWAPKAPAVDKAESDSVKEARSKVVQKTGAVAKKKRRSKASNTNKTTKKVTEEITKKITTEVMETFEAHEASSSSRKEAEIYPEPDMEETQKWSVKKVEPPPLPRPSQTTRKSAKSSVKEMVKLDVTPPLRSLRKAPEMDVTPVQSSKRAPTPPPQEQSMSQAKKKLIKTTTATKVTTARTQESMEKRESERRAATPKMDVTPVPSIKQVILPPMTPTMDVTPVPSVRQTPSPPPPPEEESIKIKIVPKRSTTKSSKSGAKPKEESVKKVAPKLAKHKSKKSEKAKEDSVKKVDPKVNKPKSKKRVKTTTTESKTMTKQQLLEESLEREKSQSKAPTPVMDKTPVASIRKAPTPPPKMDTTPVASLRAKPSKCKETVQSSCRSTSAMLKAMDTTQQSTSNEKVTTKGSSAVPKKGKKVIQKPKSAAPKKKKRRKITKKVTKREEMKKTLEESEETRDEYESLRTGSAKSGVTPVFDRTQVVTDEEGEKEVGKGASMASTQGGYSRYSKKSNSSESMMRTGSEHVSSAESASGLWMDQPVLQLPTADQASTVQVSAWPSVKRDFKSKKGAFCRDLPQVGQILRQKVRKQKNTMQDVTDQVAEPVIGTITIKEVVEMTTSDTSDRQYEFVHWRVIESSGSKRMYEKKEVEETASFDMQNTPYMKPSGRSKRDTPYSTYRPREHYSTTDDIASTSHQMQTDERKSSTASSKLTSASSIVKKAPPSATDPVLPGRSFRPCLSSVETSPARSLKTGGRQSSEASLKKYFRSGKKPQLTIGQEDSEQLENIPPVLMPHLALALTPSPSVPMLSVETSPARSLKTGGRQSSEASLKKYFRSGKKPQLTIGQEDLEQLENIPPVLMPHLALAVTPTPSGPTEATPPLKSPKAWSPFHKASPESSSRKVMQKAEKSDSTSSTKLIFGFPKIPETSPSDIAIPKEEYDDPKEPLDEVEMIDDRPSLRKMLCKPGSSPKSGTPLSNKEETIREDTQQYCSPVECMRLALDPTQTPSDDRPDFDHNGNEIYQIEDVENLNVEPQESSEKTKSARSGWNFWNPFALISGLTSKKAEPQSKKSVASSMQATERFSTQQMEEESTENAPEFRATIQTLESVEQLNAGSPEEQEPIAVIPVPKLMKKSPKAVTIVTPKTNPSGIEKAYWDRAQTTTPTGKKKRSKSIGPSLRDRRNEPKGPPLQSKPKKLGKLKQRPGEEPDPQTDDAGTRKDAGGSSKSVTSSTRQTLAAEMQKTRVVNTVQGESGSDKQTTDAGAAGLSAIRQADAGFVKKTTSGAAVSKQPSASRRNAVQPDTLHKLDKTLDASLDKKKKYGDTGEFAAEAEGAKRLSGTAARAQVEAKRSKTVQAKSLLNPDDDEYWVKKVTPTQANRASTDIADQEYRLLLEQRLAKQEKEDKARFNDDFELAKCQFQLNMNKAKPAQLHKPDTDGKAGGSTVGPDEVFINRRKM